MKQLSLKFLLYLFASLQFKNNQAVHHNIGLEYTHAAPVIPDFNRSFFLNLKPCLNQRNAHSSPVHTLQKSRPQLIQHPKENSNNPLRQLKKRPSKSAILLICAHRPSPLIPLSL